MNAWPSPPEEPPAAGDALPAPARPNVPAVGDALPVPAPPNAPPGGAHPARHLDTQDLPVAPPAGAHPARHLDTQDLPVVPAPAGNGAGPASAGAVPAAGTAAGAHPTTMRRLAGATMLVGGAFVLSRLLGLLRDQIIAARFGTGDDYATYIAAFRIPDTLFLLIIGGAVGSAFIPVFSSLLEQGRVAAAWRLTSTLINASVVVLAAGIIVLGLLAPQVIAVVIAPGWNRPAYLHLQTETVELTRIMLLSPLFLGLGGWAQGILNARHSFTLSALAPVAYNGAIIAGALFLAPNPAWGVRGLAVGVVAGALLHFLVQVPGLLRAGIQYRPFHLDFHDEGARQVAKLMLPRIVGQAAFQANIVAMTNIGSHLLPEQLSALNYGYLLMMLPHGVLALSLATVLFPTMTRQVGRGDVPAMRATLSGGLRTLIFLVLPAAVGLGFLRRPIVGLLFQFGAFHQGSTELVSAALAWFAAGLLAYAVVEVVTRGFYALHDTRTPVIVSLATVALNVALMWALVTQLHTDHTGLAFSLALTTTLEMIGLLLFLQGRLPGLLDRAFLRGVAVSGLAAALMAAVLWFLVPVLEASIWPAPDPLSVKVATGLQLLAGGVAGLAVYVAVARLFRAEELGQALALLRRRISR